MGNESLRQETIATEAAVESLPIIDRTIDNTAMSAFMTCKREYALAFMEHRRPLSTAAALQFGSYWHLVMENHYRHGGDYDKIEAVIHAWEEAGGAEPEEYRTPGRIRVAYAKYLDRWPVAPDLTSTVGYPENPLVEISTAVQGGGLVHPYAGKLDRVIVDNGLGYIEDHKTTSRLDKHYFSQFQTSNQMKGYTWMGQQLYPSIRIVGVRINLLHCTKLKTEFHRQIITFPPAIIAEWVDNTNFWLLELARIIEMARDKGIPAPRWPAHFGDNGCSRKFGLCQFHRVCSTSPSMRQAVLEQEFGINPWNPLEVADEVMDD